MAGKRLCSRTAVGGVNNEWLRPGALEIRQTECSWQMREQGGKQRVKLRKRHKKNREGTASATNDEGDALRE
jgi:hypothetical protein